MALNFLFLFPLFTQLVSVANSAPTAGRKYEQLESQEPNCAGGRKSGFRHQLYGTSLMLAGLFWSSDCFPESSWLEEQESCKTK